jgi:hypothetical protein
MSTYYSFYLGARDDAGKMCVVGPYYYSVKAGETKLGTLFETSQSFIEDDVFMGTMDMLNVEEAAEKDLDLLTYEPWYKDRPRVSNTYYAPLSEFHAIASRNNNGLYMGYVCMADMKYIVEEDYQLLNRYDVNLVSADVAAEMMPEDRRNYVKVAFTAISDASYIANLVVKAAESVLMYEYGKDKDRYYILMTRG